MEIKLLLTRFFKKLEFSSYGSKNHKLGWCGVASKLDQKLEFFIWGEPNPHYQTRTSPLKEDDNTFVTFSSMYFDGPKVLPLRWVRQTGLIWGVILRVENSPSAHFHYSFPFLDCILSILSKSDTINRIFCASISSLISRIYIFTTNMLLQNPLLLVRRNEMSTVSDCIEDYGTEEN